VAALKKTGNYFEWRRPDFIRILVAARPNQSTVPVFVSVLSPFRQQFVIQIAQPLRPEFQARILAGRQRSVRRNGTSDCKM